MSKSRASIHRTNYLTDVTVRDFRFIVDEPEESKGGNKGPTPQEYLVSSLASCIAITLKSYINLKGWPIEEINVVVSHKLLEESRTNLFEISIEVYAKIDEKTKARLKYIATNCPIHKLLENGNNELRTKISYKNGN